MDVQALRIWGIAASSAIIAVSLAVSAPWRPAVREAAQPMTMLAPLRSTDAPSPPTPVAFVVKFRGQGPLARAQALAARGHESAAARRVQTQLERQAAFRGLCFDRFTAGGAEVVLRSCSDIAVSDRAEFQTRWLALLNDMRAIEYADADAARTAGAPG